MNRTVKAACLLALACAVTLCGCKKRDDGPELSDSRPETEAAQTGASEQPVRLEDDYYGAVNHDLLEEKEIPGDSYGWNWFYELSRNGEDVQETIVSDAMDSENKDEDGSDQQKIRDFYRTAMDMDGRSTAGLGELKPWIDRIRGAESIQEYAEVMGGLFRDTGSCSLLNLFISNDLKDSSSSSWYIGPSDLGPGKETLEDPGRKEVVERYRIYVGQMLASGAGDEDEVSHLCAAGTVGTTLDPETQEAFYARVAAEVVSLQMDLAAASLPLAEQWNPEKISNYYSRPKLQELLPALDVEKVLKAAGAEEDADYLIVMEPELMKKVNSYLTEENLELLKNYSVFCLLQDYSSYLTPEIRDIAVQWNNELKGIRESRPDEKTALSLLENSLGYEIGRLYVEKAFSSEDKAAVEEMVRQLKERYEERISTMEWMEESTREAAMRKLAAMSVKVGYPDKWPEDHSQVRILPPEDGGTLIGNKLALRKGEMAELLEQPGKPIDRSRWNMTPQTVNAYYNPANNEIVFPAGILQPPYYDREASFASNLGGIGMVIAHEMSHAFDDMGAQYDEKGDLNMWWSQNDFTHFQEMGDKVAAYYDRQKILDGRSLNGRQTLGENIADLGALSCITSLVGDDQQQLRELFQRYAVIWAEKFTEEEQLNRLNTDVHSPGRVRVNAVLRCTDAFYKAYPEIKEGDGMYLAPEDRVRIW